jgi:hypothetical protein
MAKKGVNPFAAKGKPAVPAKGGGKKPPPFTKKGK